MNIDDLIPYMQLAAEKKKLFTKDQDVVLYTNTGREIEVPSFQHEGTSILHFYIRQDSRMFKPLLEQLNLRKKWKHVIPRRVGYALDEYLSYVHVDPARLRLFMPELRHKSNRALFSHGSTVKYSLIAKPTDADARFHAVKTDTPGRQLNRKFKAILAEEGLETTLPLNEFAKIHTAYGIGSVDRLFQTGREIVFYLMPNQRILCTADYKDLTPAALWEIDALRPEKVKGALNQAIFKVAVKHETISPV